MECARTFVVANISKVLALNDLLHDVVSVDARVIDPRGVTLHRVLLTSVYEELSMFEQESIHAVSVI